MIAERDGGISGSLKYNSDLFDPSTISRLISLFRNLATAVVDDPERQISQTSFLDEAERRQILEEWNCTQVDLPSQETIGSRLEERARLAPDSIAVEFENLHLTFKGLNLSANRFAHYLKSIG